MGLPPKLFEIYPHFLRTRPSLNVADHHDHTVVLRAYCVGAYYVSSRYRVALRVAMIMEHSVDTRSKRLARMITLWHVMGGQCDHWVHRVQ